MYCQSLRGRLDQARVRHLPRAGQELPLTQRSNAKATYAWLLSTRNRSTKASMSASTTS